MADSAIEYMTRKIWRSIRGRLISGNWEKRVFYLRQDYPDEIILTSSGIFLKLIGLNIDKESFLYVLERYDFIRQLHHLQSARFTIRNALFIIALRNIELNPTTAEELFIIEEIFIHGNYNFEGKESWLVIDIGVNVGIASLFFASHKDVVKVYGFEPFQPTLQQAFVNFNLNPDLKKKIEVVNYGLGNKKESMNVDYDYTHKGQVGIHGTTFIRSSLGGVEKQTIEIREASPELKKILNNHRDIACILKLDCEGSEYPIVENLFSNNLLERFKIIFIEWHERGPEILLEKLRLSGFISFHQSSSSGKVGMIYAAR